MLNRFNNNLLPTKKISKKSLLLSYKLLINNNINIIKLIIILNINNFYKSVKIFSVVGFSADLSSTLEQPGSADCSSVVPVRIVTTGSLLSEVVSFEDASASVSPSSDER